MSKLVDKERLAKLAQSLDARMKAAVKAEETRALAAEQAVDAKADQNAAAIAAINNEANGILAQAKAHVAEREGVLQKAIDAKVEESVFEAQVEELVGKDNDQQAEILALQTAVGTLQGQMGDKDMAGIQGAIDDFKVEQQGVDSVQNQRIATLEVAVNGDGADVAGLKAEMDAVEERVQAIEEADFAGAIANEAKARGEEDVRLAGLINGLDGRVAANEAFVAAQPGVDAAQNAKIEALENANKEGGAVANAIKDVADDLAAFEAAQALADAAQDEAIAAKVAQAAYNEKMTALDAEDERIAGLVATEESRAKGVEEGFETRIKANEDKLAIINGEGEGSIAKAKTDAMAHAEQKIADLVDAAPDDLNTLNELASAIKTHGTEFEAYVTTVNGQIATAKQEAINDAAGKDATLKAELQAEIDADVKAEADRAKAEEADIRADFAAADATLGNRISTLEGLVVGGEGEGLEAVIADVAQNKADIKDLKDADVELQTAIDEKVAQADYDTKVEALEGADVTLGNRIAVFEAGGGQDVAAKEVRLAAAEQDIVDLKAFEAGHSHDSMIADIAANKAAIEAEVGKDGVQGNRDKAIAAALEDYSTTEEMKAILGNVVSSLALTMENDKVVLRLGGKEGIAVTEVSLDMATDADIDAIIAGLDAE